MVGAGSVVTWMVLQPFPVLSCPGDDLNFSPKLLTCPLALWLCLLLPVSALSLPSTLLWKGIHCMTAVWESAYCPVVYESAQLSGGEYPLQRKIRADGRSFSSLSFALEVGWGWKYAGVCVGRGHCWRYPCCTQWAAPVLMVFASALKLIEYRQAASEIVSSLFP